MAYRLKDMNKEEKNEFKTLLFQKSVEWISKNRRKKSRPLTDEGRQLEAFNAGVKETLRHLGKYYNITKKENHE